MEPDYLKLNPDMSLSPDIENLISGEGLCMDDIDWCRDAMDEGEDIMVGFIEKRGSVVFLTRTKCIMVSIEDYAKQIQESK